VTVSNVQTVTNKRHQVREILITFSGAVNAAEAQDPGEYSLVMAGKRGSFAAKNAKRIKLQAASYDAANNTVALIPRKAFALTKKVQLQVNGVPPSGLQDSSGRLIDGAHTGHAGSNATFILSPGGVGKTAWALGSAGVANSASAAAVDALLELNALADVTRSQRRGRNQG
jgi:hypothetical protein